MSVRCPDNVGRAVQTDPTLLLYASAISEQKKCWELLAEKFDRFQTLRNNTQQHPTTCNRVCKRTQHVTSNNVGSCWPTMLRPFVAQNGYWMWRCMAAFFFLFSHVLRLIILGNRNVYSAYVSARRERALGFDFKLSWFMELSLISCGEAVSYNFKFEYNEFIQKLWMILWWYYFSECISCAKLLAN